MARDRYRCQVPLSPWCMDRYGTKLYKTIIKHRYLIIFALTALCIIGCENGKRNASESNDEDSTVVNDTLIAVERNSTTCGTGIPRPIRDGVYWRKGV